MREAKNERALFTFRARPDLQCDGGEVGGLKERGGAQRSCMHAKGKSGNNGQSQRKFVLEWTGTDVRRNLFGVRVSAAVGYLSRIFL